jgi:hypothetical protein
MKTAAEECREIVTEVCSYVQNLDNPSTKYNKGDLVRFTEELREKLCEVDGYVLLLCETGLMLAEYAADARDLRSIKALSYSLGWLHHGEQLSGLLEAPDVLAAYIEKHGWDRFQYTYHCNLRYACEAVREAALRIFVEGRALAGTVRLLYEMTPEMLMVDEEAAVQQITERLIVLGGVPADVSRDWLGGIDVRALCGAFGVEGESEQSVFAALGAENVENLEMLAKAVRALFDEEPA